MREGGTLGFGKRNGFGGGGMTEESPYRNPPGCRKSASTRLSSVRNHEPEVDWEAYDRAEYADQLREDRSERIRLRCEPREIR